MNLNLTRSRLARVVAAGVVLATTAGAAAEPVKPVGDAAPVTTVTSASRAVPPGYQIVRSEPKTIDPSPFEVASRVDCPDGTVAISGGESNTSPGEVVLAGSLPVNGWQASVRNTGSTPATFTVYAVCATIPSYELFSGGFVHVPPGGVGSSRQACPAGKMAIGGGPLVFGPGTTSFVTSTSSFLRYEWASEFRNEVNGRARDAVTYAACITDDPSFQIISTGWINIAAGEYRAIGLTCPDNMTALSAGVFVRDERAIITDIYPLSQFSWRLFLKNNTTIGDQYHTSITCTA